jgi:hypothetical protein
MPWYVYLAYFAAGCLLANGIPHFVNGISGRRFTMPFARPLFVGELSALINVIWGMANFLAGYALIFGVGDFTFGFTLEVLMLLAGGAVTAIGLAWYFGRVLK